MTKKKKIFMYIFMGSSQFEKKLKQRFLKPNKRGYIISMDDRHFIKISNKNPIGKCMGILLNKYRREEK